MEWSKRNEFNSFNSWKGLLYSEWYQAIKDWGENKRVKPLPPIEVSLDPIHACQLSCSWCNFGKYMVGKKVQRMPDEHIMKLVSFLGSWGALSICFGGGGDPLLHSKLADAIELSSRRGMENSIATNGIAFNKELAKRIVPICRWIGVSVDAACSGTYKIGRKGDTFKKVIENIEMLVKVSKGTKCDISYKFLIFDYNQAEIYEACLLAKKLGVRDFHARPADFRHQGMAAHRSAMRGYDRATLEGQFSRCHEIESKDFRVFTVTHKFNEDYMPKRDFSQCYAAPLGIQLCADGGIYLCPDSRHLRFYRLGRHYPHPERIQEVWGGAHHRELVFETGKENCKSRCTFGCYAAQCEELFISDKDPMCWKFI